MPKQLPEPVRRWAERYLPPGYDLVWLRCTVISDPEVIERPPYMSSLLLGRKRDVPQDTRVQFLDMDTEADGWDVRLRMVGHDIVRGDLCSLLGYAPKGADRLERPLFVLNHQTGVIERCYSDIASVTGTLMTELDYKKSLSFRVPSTVRSRLEGLRHTLTGWFLSELTPVRHRRRSAVLAAVVTAWLLLVRDLVLGRDAGTVAYETSLHPWLLALWLPLAALTVALAVGAVVGVVTLAGAALTYLCIRVVRAVMEPARFKGDVEYSFSELSGWSNVTDWLEYVYMDGTYLFQDAGSALYRWVLDHPDEDGGFVVEAVRGQGRKGFLPPDDPTQLPEAA